jgi:hypothetical protein
MDRAIRDRGPGLVPETPLNRVKRWHQMREYVLKIHDFCPTTHSRRIRRVNRWLRERRRSFTMSRARFAYFKAARCFEPLP